MRAFTKLFPLLVAAFGLASCGGGSGGSQSAFNPTPVDSITLSAASSSIPAGSFTTITVTVKKQDGTVENDGTAVNASISPPTIGTISGAAGSAGATASNTLTGGKTTFNFASSNQTGTATVTVSLPAGTNGSTSTATASIPITVTPGNGQDARLKLSATSTTLPVNLYSFEDQQKTPFPGNFPGSPYMSEVTLTLRHSNGQLVAGTTTVNVSASPTAIIEFSTLNTTGAPFSGSGPVEVVGGVGTIYVHSGQTPGTATLIVTATDPDNAGQTISSQLTINVAGAASNLPATVSISSSGTAYISSSGGPGSSVVNATVRDGNNALVPDPAGFNNVKFEIAGPAGTDARLSGVNAAGPVTGTSVTTVTHNGIASVSLLAGTQQGPVQIKATADRGDNNVDNGIQDPVSATTTVVISDGKLFSLTLSTPSVNAILVDRVSTDATLINQGGGTVTIPPDPNAIYSLTVTAIGVDRQGNPIIPGTVVRFGSIDAPQTNGSFSISGTQGNPKEGGTLFTATDGHFRTAGGGAGPGDTLLVFGKDVEGNADLESAVKVTAVNSETSLTVGTPFNLNDTTGTSVDYGSVLPYIVGRAQTGNITSPASTNAFGVASTTLNYPVSALGRAVAIWAQSDSTDAVTNLTDTVTDAQVLVFPGVAPATITISPNPIPGNFTTTVTACIADALSSPLAGVRFTFEFANMGIGVGKLDGITGEGVVPDATDASGCVATTVTTTGIAGNTGNAGNVPTLTFSAGKATASAPIVASGALELLAKPSALGGNGGDVKLTLLNGNGTPVPGVQIVGTCEGDNSIGLLIPPGVTDSTGSTKATIVAHLDGINTAGSGTCTFTTSTGSPTVVVKLKGIDQCSLGVSPAPPGCAASTVPVNLTVNLQNTTASGVGYGSVTSSPTGLSCAMSAPTPLKSCTNAFTTGDSVVLTRTLAGGATSAAWSGACAAGGIGPTATVLMSSAKTCTLTFSP